MKIQSLSPAKSSCRYSTCAPSHYASVATSHGAAALRDDGRVDNDRPSSRPPASPIAEVSLHAIFAAPCNIRPAAQPPPLLLLGSPPRNGQRNVPSQHGIKGRASLYDSSLKADALLTQAASVACHYRRLLGRADFPPPFSKRAKWK